MPTDGIIFRTDDALKWGVGKGSNLQAVDVDSNFWNLLQRMEAVETNPAQPNQIASIDYANGSITITTTDAVVHGPYAIPQAAFVFRGAWLTSTPYAVNDVVRDPLTGIYLVLVAHTTDDPPAVFDPNAVDGSANPLYQFLLPAATYDAAFYATGTPGYNLVSGEAMFGHIAARPFYLPAGAPNSTVRVLTAPSADLTCNLQKDGVSFGSFTIASGALTGTYTIAADEHFVAGDYLTIMPPASLDLTAKDLIMTLAGVRE